MMRLGRLALLVGIVAALAVTTALARARRVPSPATVAPVAAPVAARVVALVATPVSAPVVPVVAPANEQPAPSPSAAASGPPARADEAKAATRIDALVQTGDIGRARDEAEGFLRRYPFSRYCEHIETLTGVHPRPPIPGE